MLIDKQAVHLVTISLQSVENTLYLVVRSQLILMAPLAVDRHMNSLYERVLFTLCYQTPIVSDWNYRVIQMNASVPVRIAFDVHSRKLFHTNMLNPHHDM